MKPIYEESFRVCTWDSDSSLRLTPASACNFCQEAAGTHAEELGVGIDAMSSQGVAWILSRMSLVLDRRPARGEKVVVRTWPIGSARLFVHRDYELSDSSGAIIGRGRSAWLIIDTERGRPRRPEPLIGGLPQNEGREALPDGVPALEEAPGLARAYSRTAAYSDLDYNGHVNNARYVQWVQDALAADALASAGGFRLDINYLSEVRAGTSVSIFGAAVPADGGVLHRVEGRREEDSAPVFRAELLLR
jgi:acyl-ACP thioesterase